MHSPNLVCQDFFVTDTVFVCKILRQVVLADLIPKRAEAVTGTSELLLIRPRVELKFARILCGASTIVNENPTILFRVFPVRKVCRALLFTSRTRPNQSYRGKQGNEKKQKTHPCVMMG